MKTKKISTELQAKSAGPGEYRITGPVGLYLQVSETGASYFYRYWLGGRRREMGLKSRKEVTIREARNAAAAAKALKDQGIDPIEARRREREDNIAKSRTKPKLAFGEAADLFLEAHGGEWRHKYARSIWLNPLKAYAFPIIGHLGLDQIEVEHVVEVMKRAEDAGATEQARRLRQRIEQVINFATRRGLRAATRLNPADSKLHPSRRKGERAHYRAVDLNDAPEIFQRLKAEDSTACNAWVFMIACASRPSEALNGLWSEIDPVQKLWVLPATRMKSAKPHTTPLSSIALEILERQARVKTGDSIFPGRGGSPLSYASFATAPAKLGIAAASPHGWRSVFRDWCGDIGEIPRDLAEAALAHSLGSVEASYRRRTAIARRSVVMQQYGDWLDGKSAQVIAFPNSKKGHVRG